MFGRFQRVIVVATAAVSVIPAGSVEAATLVISQKAYLFQIAHCREVAAETYVLSSVQKPPPLQSDASSVSGRPAHCTHQIVIPFQVSSADILPETITSLLATLQTCNISMTTPLDVTGYSCSEGPAAFNRHLAEQRAQAVARLLEHEGYSPGTVEGREAAARDNHISPAENRRVEITAARE